MNTPAPLDATLARQRRTVIALAVLMIAMGIVVLTFLARLPVPVRLLTGFGDILIGVILLVLVRQQRKT